MDPEVICDEAPLYGAALPEGPGTSAMGGRGFFDRFDSFFFLFQFRSASSAVALLLLAAAVMAGMPALYRIVYRPRYILYKDRLEIHKGLRRETVALSSVKPACTLPWLYEMDGKRIYLLTSDDFLKPLNERMEILRRGWE